jgi:hypothetical protein
MAVVRIAMAFAIDMCNLIVDGIDVGTAAAGGKLRIFEGALPADTDTPITTQPMLVEFTLPVPAFGDAAPSGVGATATANVIPTVAASASGGDPNPLFYRIFDRDDNPVIDGDVSGPTGSGSLKIDATEIVQNVNVSIVSLTISQRNK